MSSQEQMKVVEEQLAYLISCGALTERAAKKMRPDPEDAEGFKEDCDDLAKLYAKNFKAPKVAKMTEEELEASRKAKRDEYLASLPLIKPADTKELPYGVKWSDISKQASKLGRDLILAELEKLSTTKATSCVVRKDGTKGANHVYYKNAYDYKKDAEGNPELRDINNGKNTTRIHAVVLDRPKAKNTSTHYTLEELADTSKYMCLESVCKDTNPDGLRQLYENPVIFDTNPEWNGSGCKCAIKNKKLNLQLHKYNEKSKCWIKHDLGKKTPTFCCNGKVASDGKCKRHSKGETTEWTALGAGWTVKEL